MRRIRGEFSISVSELKKNPLSLLSRAYGSPIAVLHRNEPAAYLVPAETFEALMDALENYELSKVIDERRDSKDQAVLVSLDDL